MNPMQKRPAYIYAKDFKLKKVLGNLQAYKLATGDVDSKKIDSVTKKYGGDEGAIFGSLITNAAGETKRKAEEERNHMLKRKRRKKRKKRRGAEGDGKQETSSSTSLQTVDLAEPLAIPQAILAYGSSESEEETADHSDSHCTEDGTKSSSDSDEMHDGKDQDKQQQADFFGLTSTQSSSDSDESSSADRFTHERLATPSAAAPIQAELASKRPHPVSKDLPAEGFSSLSTYKCWKCNRRGHLVEDCTTSLNLSPGTTCYGRGIPATGPTLYQGKQGKTIYSPLLREYYQKCKKLQSSHNAQCAECGRKSNLGSCLECGLVLCDGRGHLIAHVLDYPTHTKWYSYKLQRQIKCCKSTCEVMDIDELLMCSCCLDKFFNLHYSMVNATWSGKGLKAIPNTLACDEHFYWHRMNCLNTGEEKLATREKLEGTGHAGDGFLSEFYF